MRSFDKLSVNTIQQTCRYTWRSRTASSTNSAPDATETQHDQIKAGYNLAEDWVTTGQALGFAIYVHGWVDCLEASAAVTSFHQDAK